MSRLTSTRYINIYASISYMILWLYNDKRNMVRSGANFSFLQLFEGCEKIAKQFFVGKF
jgi:hypothetical protein